MAKNSSTSQPNKSSGDMSKVEVKCDQEEIVTSAHSRVENNNAKIARRASASTKKVSTQKRSGKKRPVLILRRNHDQARTVRRYIMADRDWMLILIMATVVLIGSVIWSFVVYDRARTGGFGRSSSVAQIRSDQIDWGRLDELVQFMSERSARASEITQYDIGRLLNETLDGQSSVLPNRPTGQGARATLPQSEPPEVPTIPSLAQ